MKKRNILTLFMAIWFSFGNKGFAVIKTDSLKEKNQRQELVQNNRILFDEETLMQTTEKLNEKTKEFQLLVDELNFLNAYVFVTTRIEKKNMRNKKKSDFLLGLTSEVRLDDTEPVTNYRIFKILLTRFAKKRLIVRRTRLTVDAILRSNRLLASTIRFRNASAYCVENAFGYKSICPVFFDRLSAENFLIKAISKRYIVMRSLYRNSYYDRATFQSFLNTKIKVVKLGNLIKYLTKLENKNIFDKFEFLLMPNLNQSDELTHLEKKMLKKIIQNKKFKFYQEQFSTFHKQIEEIEIEYAQQLKQFEKVKKETL